MFAKGIPFTAIARNSGMTIFKHNSGLGALQGTLFSSKKANTSTGKIYGTWHFFVWLRRIYYKPSLLSRKRNHGLELGKEELRVVVEAFGC